MSGSAFSLSGPASRPGEAAGLTFGAWWMYFGVPWAEPLVRHRERGFWFGYGHLVIFASLAAMGAGLHVAAIRLDGEAKIGA